MMVRDRIGIAISAWSALLLSSSTASAGEPMRKPPASPVPVRTLAQPVPPPAAAPRPAPSANTPAFAAGKAFGLTDFSVKGSALTFLPDGKRILIHGGSSGATGAMQVELRELATGRRLSALGPNAYSMTVARDGSLIATGGTSITLTDTRTHRAIRPLLSSSAPAVVPLGFSPDSSALAIAENAPKKKGLVVLRLSSAKAGQSIRQQIRMNSPENLEYGTAAFSGNSKWLAVGCQRFSVGACPIHVYDTEKGTQVHAFIVHQQGIRGLSFSADGRFLVSVAHDAVILWNLQTRMPRIFDAEILLPSEHQPRLWSAALSPDGRILAVGTDEAILLLDPAKGAITRKLKPAGLMVMGLTFAPDGATLGSISGNTLEFWDSRGGLRKGGPERHTGRVETVRWAGSSRILSHGPDGKVKVWDFASGHLEKEVDSPYQSLSTDGEKVFLRPARVMDLQGSFAEKPLHGIDPDLNLARWCPDRTMALAEQVTRSVHQLSRAGGKMASLKLGQAMTGLNGIRAIECREFRESRSTGTRLFVGGGSFRTPAGNQKDSGFLGIWDPPKAKWTKMHTNLPLPIQKFVNVSSGRTYAVAASYNEFAVFEAVTGLEVSRVPSGRFLLYSHSLSPSGELLAFGGEKGTVLLWNLDESRFQVLRGNAIDGKPGFVQGPARPIEEQELRRMTDLVATVEFLPDGKRLFSARPEGGADVWDMPTGKWVGALGRRGERVTAMSVSPDQRWLLAGLADGTLRAWMLSGLRPWVAPPPRFKKEPMPPEPGQKASGRKLNGR